MVTHTKCLKYNQINALLEWIHKMTRVWFGTELRRQEQTSLSEYCRSTLIFKAIPLWMKKWRMHEWILPIIRDVRRTILGVARCYVGTCTRHQPFRNVIARIDVLEDIYTELKDIRSWWIELRLPLKRNVFNVIPEILIQNCESILRFCKKNWWDHT